MASRRLLATACLLVLGGTCMAADPVALADERVVLRAVTETGQPVADAIVHFWRGSAAFESNSQQGEVTLRTDTEGQCVIEFFETSARVLIIDETAGCSGWSELGPLDLLADPVDVTLWEPWTLTGRVEEIGGAPAPGALIEL